MLWVELVGYAGFANAWHLFDEEDDSASYDRVCANCLLAAYGFLTPRLPTTGTARPQLWPTTPLRN